MNKNKSCCQNGFTLIEIIIVIVIITLVISASVITIHALVDSQRLKSAAVMIRAEISEARALAMEIGQIVCIRCQIGGDEIIIDKILDAHFTAGLSSRSTSRKYDLYNELDPFESGGFVGDYTDFIIKDPSNASKNDGTRFVKLPTNVKVSDVISIPEERATFYLGLTNDNNATTDEETLVDENIDNRNIRLGETSSGEKLWSTPIFFYPDGTCSTSALLLKNNKAQCIEIRLRGITGLTKVTETFAPTTYIGELDPTR
ncbi:MAG: prepilin-type N-terminal cleavage/methylation domain-containing protein [Planctomycetaceae bacterium]|jgi:prepilin-type N-terminal cleavage/methylation domain-containing protein|nr:prepilin-type N-terminal cleavage/methylation domain-containing protein [Planctomycetaceae bacterium]